MRRSLALSAVFMADVAASASASGAASACLSEACDASAEAAQEDASLLQVVRAGDGNAGSAGANVFNAKVLPVPDGNLAGGDKLGLGACISGGGNRAFTWTLGIFRSLNEFDLMQNFDAISGVSGGAWISGLYTFAQGHDVDLLGPPTHPRVLTLDYLKQYDSKFGQLPVEATNSVLLEVALFNSPHEVWQRFIGQVYLKPFGLNDQDAYMAASQDDVASIKKRNPSLEQAKFVVQRPDRQYQWRAMCTLLGPVGYFPGTNNVVSFEVMPSFSGFPGFPNGSTVTYVQHPQAKKGQEELTAGTLTALVGGGFVETFAFGGAAPEQIPEDVGQMVDTSVPAPKQPFTLADAIGYSSSQPAAQLANTVVGGLADPRSPYWPIPGEKFQRQDAIEHEFGDGGSIDNSGLLSLLLRSTQKVVWVADSYKPLNMSYDWNSTCAQDSEVEFDPVTAGVIDSVIDKFGYGEAVTDPKGGFYYSQNQVFEKSKLLDLSCELWRLVYAGEPAVVEFTETVLPNPWWQIKGDYDVKILIFYMAPATKFMHQLPVPTQEEIKKGAEGSFANFPHYKTKFQNGVEVIYYTKSQVNLLAAQAEWTVKRAIRKVANFLGN